MRKKSLDEIKKINLGKYSVSPSSELIITTKIVNMYISDGLNGIELSEAEAELNKLKEKIKSNELNLDEIRKEKAHIMEMKKKYDNMTDANIERTKVMLNATEEDGSIRNLNYTNTNEEFANISIQARPAALIYKTDEDEIR